MKGRDRRWRAKGTHDRMPINMEVIKKEMGLGVGQQNKLCHSWAYNCTTVRVHAG